MTKRLFCWVLKQLLEAAGFEEKFVTLQSTDLKISYVERGVAPVDSDHSAAKAGEAEKSTPKEDFTQTVERVTPTNGHVTCSERHATSTDGRVTPPNCCATPPSCFATPPISQVAPSFLFLHGFAADKSCWAPLVRRFHPNVHCVALDWPGHGSSQGKAKDVSISAFVSLVLDFVLSSSLRHAPRLHVVGHSLGGAVAGQFVATHGAACRVSHLTLIDPAMATPSPSPFMVAVARGEGAKWLTPETPDELRLTLKHAVGRWWLRRWVRSKVVVDVIHDVYMQEARRQFLNHVWEELKEELMNSDRYISEWKQKVTVPTLVVWGQKDGIIDVSGAAKIKEHMPDVVVELMEESGHSPFLEEPGRCADIVLKFTNKGI